jgi:hypothetical protein
MQEDTYVKVIRKEIRKLLKKGDKLYADLIYVYNCDENHQHRLDGWYLQNFRRIEIGCKRAIQALLNLSYLYEPISTASKECLLNLLYHEIAHVKFSQRKFSKPIIEKVNKSIETDKRKVELEKLNFHWMSLMNIEQRYVEFYSIFNLKNYYEEACGFEIAFVYWLNNPLSLPNKKEYEKHIGDFLFKRIIDEYLALYYYPEEPLHKGLELVDPNCQKIRKYARRYVNELYATTLPRYFLEG